MIDVLVFSLFRDSSFGGEGGACKLNRGGRTDSILCSSVTLQPNSLLTPHPSIFSCFFFLSGLYFLGLSFTAPFSLLSCTLLFLFPPTLHFCLFSPQFLPPTLHLAPFPLPSLFLLFLQPPLPLILLPSVVDFSLVVAVIHTEMDGLALQSFPPLLLVMDLSVRLLESF